MVAMARGGALAMPIKRIDGRQIHLTKPNGKYLGRSKLPDTAKLDTFLARHRSKTIRSSAFQPDGRNRRLNPSELQFLLTSAKARSRTWQGKHIGLSSSRGSTRKAEVASRIRFTTHHFQRNRRYHFRYHVAAKNSSAFGFVGTRFQNMAVSVAFWATAFALRFAGCV